MSASTATALRRIAAAAAVTLFAGAALAEEAAARRAVETPRPLGLGRTEAAQAPRTACAGRRESGRIVHCILVAKRPQDSGK